MFKKEPVLILLGGLAVLVNLALVMLVLLNAITLDGIQTAAIVATVQGFATLTAAMIRGNVYSPATHDADVVAAFIEGSL